MNTIQKTKLVLGVSALTYLLCACSVTTVDIDQYIFSKKDKRPDVIAPIAHAYSYNLEAELDSALKKVIDGNKNNSIFYMMKITPQNDSIIFSITDETFSLVTEGDIKTDGIYTLYYKNLLRYILVSYPDSISDNVNKDIFRHSGKKIRLRFQPYLLAPDKTIMYFSSGKPQVFKISRNNKLQSH